MAEKEPCGRWKTTYFTVGRKAGSESWTVSPSAWSKNRKGGVDRKFRVRVTRWLVVLSHCWGPKSSACAGSSRWRCEGLDHIIDHRVRLTDRHHHDDANGVQWGKGCMDWRGFFRDFGIIIRMILTYSQFVYCYSGILLIIWLWIRTDMQVHSIITDYDIEQWVCN